MSGMVTKSRNLTMYGMATSRHMSLIYEGVFSVWFSSVAYQHWIRQESRFQLRCCGGPGSGKTTFSALLVDRLKRSPSCDTTAVVSIFLQPIDQSKRQKAIRLTPRGLLNEIQRQLHLITCDTFQKKNHARENLKTSIQEPHGSEINDVDSLRCAIESQIKSLDRVFLVLDDLDLAWENFEDYQNLEDELDLLNEKGIKILTTSRVQFKCDTRYGECDANERHRGRLVDFWWQCSICRFEDPEVQDPYYICDECKNSGHRCPEPKHSNLELVQPRTRVHLDIGSWPLKRFLEYQLEEEHGDLGFGSHGGSFVLPPLSSLGHELVSSPQKAAALVTHLNKRARGNITIALLHLQDISQIMSFKEATTVSDRLPKSTTAYFDAMMASIVNGSIGLRSKLGLASVKSAGQRVEGLLFSDLENTLLASLKCSSADLEEVLDSTYRMESVIAASRGLLCPEGDSTLVCYHDLFQLYVEQQYSDLLI